MCTKHKTEEEIKFSRYLNGGCICNALSEAHDFHVSPCKWTS